MADIQLTQKRTGVLIGGSGLIGGALQHYFKTRTPDIEVLSPNSKKLSLREPEDIRAYFDRYRPDFIINTAIASIDSDAQLALEINYLGTLRLAQIAIERNIPYVHFSSAATMPAGENLNENDLLPLAAGLSNYTKSKLMAEITLRHLHASKGLDYTNIRLAVVYGKHDHKIQGFHRMLYSLADEAMPVLLTRRGVRHSYSHSKKIPPFVHYILDHREEFSGNTYNFVDQEPVELARLILTIKSYLNLKRPRQIFIPYPMARIGKTAVHWLVRRLNGIGIEARMPAELLFMEQFYQSQTLSPRKLVNSSYGDPFAKTTVFTRLPAIIEYYISRWEHLNLITSYNPEHFDPKKRIDTFINTPERLLDTIHQHGDFLPSDPADPCRQR
ncbi:MAG: NAD(P)-dependent oxidoreductase [Thermodesulfobacteriota bacterium]